MCPQQWLSLPWEIRARRHPCPVAASLPCAPVPPPPSVGTDSGLAPACTAREWKMVPWVASRTKTSGQATGPHAGLAPTRKKTSIFSNTWQSDSSRSPPSRLRRWQAHAQDGQGKKKKASPKEKSSSQLRFQPSRWEKRLFLEPAWDAAKPLWPRPTLQPGTSSGSPGIWG